MGFSCNTYCETCNTQAVELGDQGYIGTASPKSYIKKHNDEYYWVEVSFGWFYKGLSAIKYIPAEIEEYNSFLKKHKDHNVRVLCDEDDSNIDWDNLLHEKTLVDKSNIVKGKYTITNKKNGMSVNSSSWNFIKFSPYLLSKSDKKTFIKHFIVHSEALECIHNPPPPLDQYEDFLKITDFIAEYPDDELEVFIDNN